MAKNITLKAKLQGANKTKKGLKGIDGGLKKLGRSAIKATAAIAGARALVNSFKEATDAATKQFIAESKLASGLKNVEGASADGARALFEYAKQLQNVTTFGDENIISGMAMLSTFQLNETQIKAITPRMLDMAAATNEAALAGGDLNPIALQLGKAFTGQVSALTRSGVVIDQSALAMARAKGSAEEFNFILNELDKNFEGIAESIAKSGVGKMLQMRNQISDNKELIGTQMIPVQEAWTNTMVKASQKMAELTVFVKAMIEAEGGFNDKLKAGHQAVAQLNEDYDKQIESLKVLEQQKIRNQIFLEEQELVALQQRIDLQHQGLTLDEQLLLVGNEIELNRVLLVEGIISENEMKKRNLQLTSQQITLEEQLRDAKISAGVGLLNSLSQLAGENKNLTLLSAKLAQAAAIVDMYAGANKAFKQGGVLGHITGASIILAGLANISQIQSQISEIKSAAIGADFTTSGPQMIMVGDNPGGKERVQVTPLSSPNLEGPQNSGVTVQFNGPITNDDYVRDFIVPEIQKATRLNLA